MPTVFLYNIYGKTLYAPSICHRISEILIVIQWPNHSKRFLDFHLRFFPKIRPLFPKFSKPRIRNMSSYKTVQEIKQIDPSLAVPFRSIFILRRKTTKMAKNGNPFLSVELGDSGGSFTANCFGDSEVFKALDPVNEGSIVRISGKTEYYQDRFSPRLQAAEAIEAKEAEEEEMLGQLVEIPPESETELWNDIVAAIAAIDHPQLRETVQRVMD